MSKVVKTPDLTCRASCHLRSARNRCKGVDAFGELNTQYIGVASKVLKVISTYCAHKTSELCPFLCKRQTAVDASWKKKCFYARADFLNKAMIAPFSGNFMPFSRKYSTPHFQATL